MNIISYNVNGIRAAIRKGLLDWIRIMNADIICIQETKAQPDQIPQFDFEELGYINYWFSAEKKGYSGVALLTKKEPDKVIRGMGIEKYDREGRIIRADYGDVSVISVYHPSGSSGEERQAFKMEWLHDFKIFVDELKKERPKLIISGDYNICHEAIDIHDPVRNAKSSGFLPEERKWMTQFLNSGFIDSFRYLNKEPDNYTWWSFRGRAREKNMGWRIDYEMVSEPLKDKIERALILPSVNFSDHCPIILEMDIH